MMRFHTLLIANRGEIALRVIRSARRLGLRTVAVYSDADAQARHVREADMAVHIGSSESSNSYRNIAAILEACARTGAQAVHPGYGFLSENADFARAVTQAGLIFVGPRADVIELMGNKARAKEAMQAAGVPTVPGLQGVASLEALTKAAHAIGYPVILKAAAGGGGRGMRLAQDAADLAKMLALARSEALGAFGSDELILEKAIQLARHIEIQVLCDEHGNHLHLGERDCSLQRRYQKIVEESPSPAVSQVLRDEMGAVATRACKAIGYTGVGTLEFLLSPDGSFYFMEMNTRLQVEHGVTELVTGLDLVECQLNVAQGEPLSFGQSDVRMNGHAMELRVCAEDPYAGFLPQVGDVLRWREPADIRVDAALEDGTQVSHFYDSMLAKFLAWAPSREACIAKLSMACERTALLGIKSNLGFLARAINHPVFINGGVDTAFLAREDLSADYWAVNPTPSSMIAATLVLSGLAGDGPTPRIDTLTPSFEMLLQVPAQAAGVARQPRLIRITPVAGGGAHMWSWLGENPQGEPEIIHCSFWARRGDELTLVINGVRRQLRIACPDVDKVWVQDGLATGCYERVTVFSAREGLVQSGLARVRAPMSGRVIALSVASGAAVQAQQTVLVLESMKMEMSIVAGWAGTVTQINIAAGDQVSTGQVLMEVER